jgi:hypothetical protein
LLCKPAIPGEAPVAAGYCRSHRSAVHGIAANKASSVPGGYFCHGVHLRAAINKVVRGIGAGRRYPAPNRIFSSSLAAIPSRKFPKLIQLEGVHPNLSIAVASITKYVPGTKSTGMEAAFFSTKSEKTKSKIIRKYAIA